ncbi:MAG: hypothetical protein K0R41_1907 [Geminicoccaceae bacterium]|nr:hypothetical protein [Geminicoccaceae bacterium]
MKPYSHLPERIDGRNVRQMAHVKNGVIVACRLGDVMHPHVVVVAGTRHDHLGGRMELTKLSIELAAIVPGNIGAVGDVLTGIMPKARQRAAEGLGKHMLVVDMTRQQQAYKLLLERLEIDVPLIVTTHGRLAPSVPYWACGRITLLSHLATQLSRPGVVNVLQPASKAETVQTPQQIKDALSAAQARPPKEEADAFVTETTTQDDLALAIAAAAQWGELGAPDPWVGEPMYAVS